MKLFKRKPKSVVQELAPQLTIYDRASIAQPGTPFGMLSSAVYDEMEKDSMIQTVLTLKKLAVVASDTSIEPADSSEEAKRRASFVDQCFASMEGSLLDVIHSAMDAFAKGVSIQELVYEPSGSNFVLKAVRPKDPSGFGLDVDRFGRLDGLLLRLPGEPEVHLPKSKFVVYINRRSYSSPKGRSDLDAAYKHWRAKTSLLSAWKLHLEKYAMPTVLGRYERGMPPSELDLVFSALKNLQESAAVIHPREVEVSVLGGHKEPSTGFQEAIEFHNREIARAVLGQTLTTDEGRRVGSLALGKVHLQILLLQVNAIRREIAESVITEQVIRPLVELNFGPGLLPKFVFKDSGVSAFATGELG